MIDILRERISDERFLRLIRKFLNAGYIGERKQSSKVKQSDN
jgi:retron-type reverse transcriptase